MFTGNKITLICINLHIFCSKFIPFCVQQLVRTIEFGQIVIRCTTIHINPKTMQLKRTKKKLKNLSLFTIMGLFNQLKFALFSFSIQIYLCNNMKCLRSIHAFVLSFLLFSVFYFFYLVRYSKEEKKKEENINDLA